MTDLAPDPTPITPSHDRYVEMYHEDVDPKYRPWYDFAYTPRAYYTHDRGDEEEGAIVVDVDRMDGVWDTIADALREAFGARIGKRGILLHEHGHAQGHGHPEDSGRFLDVMGAPSLRTRDRHNVVPDALDWANKHGLLDK